MKSEQLPIPLKKLSTIALQSGLLSKKSQMEIEIGDALYYFLLPNDQPTWNFQGKVKVSEARFYVQELMPRQK